MARNTGNNNRDRMLNRNEKKPNEAKELDNSQKGIQKFFGEKERRFFESSGREITEEILQESFILYRMDYKRTRTLSHYLNYKRHKGICKRVIKQSKRAS